MARDRYHAPIRDALLLAGWDVQEDYRLQFGRRNLFVDLAAQLITADRGTERIAVEVKDFVTLTPMGTIYAAIGQYLVYKSLLLRVDPQRQLYLGISQNAVKILFLQLNMQIIIEDYGINLMIVDIKERRIIEWR